MTDLDLRADFQNRQEPVDNIVKKIRRFQVHALNQNRSVSGEYYHLFPILKRYPEKFRMYMRMEVSTFEYILNTITPHSDKNWSNFHTQPILHEQRLVLTLRFLATGLSYSDLSFSFRMGVTTVCEIVKETMDLIYQVLSPIHIPLLDEEKLINTSKKFSERRGFVHCLGAVDCKHFRIKKPANSGVTYRNYKKFYSLKLQAVVDSDFKFMSIDVGGYGSEHDARTLRNSSFYEAVWKYKLISLPKKSALQDDPSTVLPYYFIGDGAYPLMENLMKPYRGKDLIPYKKKFNECLSNARVVVECAFGIMAKKWKIFATTMEFTPATVRKIIECTCVLQNIIFDLEKKHTGNNVYCEQDLVAEANSVFEEVEGEEQENAVENDHDFPVGTAKQIQAKLAAYIWRKPS